MLTSAGARELARHDTLANLEVSAHYEMCDLKPF